MKKLLVTGIACLSMSYAAFAYADNNIGGITNLQTNQYKDYSKSLTNVLGYKTTTTPEALGWIGFDVGATYTQASSTFKLSDSTQGSHQVDILSVNATKGLPGGFNVSLQYDSVFNSSISSMTGELRYALVEGGLAIPSISVGGFYSKTNGIDDLEFNSFGADIGISKGFANLTPFANLGLINSNIESKSVALDESPTLFKVSAGLNVNLVMFDVLVGYNQIGGEDSYSIKAGYRF
jgi:hypothetical protein